MILVLASNNAGKLREFREILAPLDITVVPQSAVGADFEVNETGDTFEENAYLKASSVVSFSHFPVVADDSGLCVDALDGAPGVHTARFGGGKDWTDEQKYELTNSIRMKMCRLALKANEVYDKYEELYVTGESLRSHIIKQAYGGTTIKKQK